MANSYCINYQHIVFRCRACTIRTADLAELHAYIAGTLLRLGVMDIKVGGVCDHIHILGQFGFLHLPDVVRSCKLAATIWLKKRDPQFYVRYHWQKKFGSFSVSPQHVLRVRRYIANQERHHTKQTTYEEIRYMVEHGRV